MPQDNDRQDAAQTDMSRPPRTQGQAQASLLHDLLFFVRGFQLAESWYGVSMVDQLFGYGHREALEDARQALIARDATPTARGDA